MIGRAFLLSTFTIVFFACQKDPSLVVEPSLSGLEHVDSRLHPLFQAFQKEASQRGVTVDYTRLNIEGAIEDIPEDQIAGLCRWGGNHQSVTIDSRIWNTNNTVLRELITFHELGHCVLNLGHDDSVINSNVCKSIMHSGLGDCRTLYSDNRNYYLDELFEKSND